MWRVIDEELGVLVSALPAVATLLDAVVVTTGAEAHRRPDGVAVVPAAALGL